MAADPAVLLELPECVCMCFSFFVNDTATTEIYTLSLHDALPICRGYRSRPRTAGCGAGRGRTTHRSEEHTSGTPVTFRNLVCRLLLAKKNISPITPHSLASRTRLVTYSARSLS